MKKRSLKIAFILGLGIAAVNLSACNNAKVEEAKTEISNEIDSIEVPDLDSVETPDIDITPDTELENAAEAAVKGFPGVRADVNDGVIVLKGEIAKDRLPALMKAINDLKPKRVDNKLEVE